MEERVEERGRVEERERDAGGRKGHRHTHRGGDTVGVSVSVCDKRVTREMHGCQAGEGAR